MMKRFLIIPSLLALVAPSFAADDAVSVSAGEHGAFSRVAFDNGRKSVRVERDGRIVRLKNLNPNAAFSLDEINVRHKAHRIAGATVAAKGRKKIIEIELSCDCETRAGVADNGKFVLDVFEKKPGAPTILTATNDKSSTRDEKPKEASADEPDTLSVENAHKQMVALLEQAAKDGLITIRGAEGVEEQRRAETEEENAAPKPALSPIMASARPETTAPQVSPPAPPKPAASMPAKKAAVENHRCISDAAFSIEGDAFDEEPLVAIADLQTELADAETDDKPGIVRALTQGYLAIGFGEEATALLKDYGQGKTVLADLARAVAERPLRANGALLNAENCSGAHAMWQAVAIEDAPHASLYRRSNGAVKTLPSRLRSMIAARLAMQMAAADAWPEAEELVNIATADGARSPEIDYVNARLEEYRGNADASRDALLDIAAQNNDAADDALLALADSYLKDEATPHPGFTQDIGAVAKLHDTPKAVLAEAMAWADVGNIEASLMLLRGLAEKTPKDTDLARKAARTVFDAAFASDSELTQLSALDALMSNDDWFSLGEGDRERRERAARLALKFGLPNLAFEVLGGDSLAEDPAVSRIMAEAALAAGQADDAIKIAAPHTESHTFRNIIARANLYSGQYHVALATAATLADENQKAALSARAAWLGRSWQSAARHFQNLDPNLLNPNTALQYALSAYMAQDAVVPVAADAVFSKENGAIANGLRSLFSNPPKGSALERSRQSVEQTGAEIRMIEEVLDDG